MKKEDNDKKYYFVAVKQMQYFEIEMDEKDAPLTEEIFWNEYYAIDHCELDSTIEKIKEVDRLWTL